MPTRRPARFTTSVSCSDAERQTLSAWSATGALQGDLTDLPPAPAFVEGWSLGKPDIVLEMQEDYSVPARGVD